VARWLAATLVFALPGATAAGEVERLVAALLGDTPLVEDLRHLTDVVGGRPTGSAANDRAVAWAVERFRAAGLDARTEPFAMPALWLERQASAEIRSLDGDVRWSVRVAAMPYSTATAAAGLEAALVDAGHGTAADFARLGASAEGALALVETDELEDVAGLFREYTESVEIEARARDAGVAGVVYVGSRPRSVLYRHNASLGPANRHPMAVVERDAGLRALRLLRAGRPLAMTLLLDLELGGPYESHNVVAELPGRERPEEFVVIGAHLDSWGLGTGALDNGCNVALVIDVARQMRRLGLAPRRTVRFVLFNGEEQGLHGSLGYVRRHREALDRHVMASSYDIGSGRIRGFFTNGREPLVAAVDAALAPVAGLGPFTQVNEPIVGTDNYDFMMEGVGNLVADQESANYGPNYHAASDTFDKVDRRQLRLNAAVAGAVTWAFAEMDVDWERQSRAEIEALVESSDLRPQMERFGLWQPWLDGTRGRAEQ
jgi:hypothetical protein